MSQTLKISNQHNQKLKELAKLFNLSISSTIYLCLDYAYNYYTRLDKAMPEHSLQENESYKTKNLPFSNDLDYLEDLNTEKYEDILCSGIDLLHENNMIYPKRDNQKLIKIITITLLINIFISIIISSL